jgi:hypothetical protein
MQINLVFQILSHDALLHDRYDIVSKDGAVITGTDSKIAFGFTGSSSDSATLLTNNFDFPYCFFLVFVQ